MSTTLATRNTHYAPHARIPSRPVGGVVKTTKAKRSEPSPKPKPTAPGGERRKYEPKTERIDVVLERRHGVPKLVTEHSPTSSPGPLTPPTPPAGPASIRSKHSRSSLRPPTDQHSSRTTIHRPRPVYAYTPDVKPNLQTLNDKGRDTRDIEPDTKPDVKPDVQEPADERIRDLKGLEAYGVRFVQRTDDVRGTQVLARDADFAADVAYLSRPAPDRSPSLPSSSGFTMKPQILAHAHRLRFALEDCHARRVPDTTHKLVFELLRLLSPPCAVAEKAKLPKETKRGRKAYQLGLRNDEVEIFGDALLLADYLSGADLSGPAIDRWSDCQLPYLFAEVGQGDVCTEEACVRLTQRMRSGLAAYADLYGRAHDRAGYGHRHLYRCDVSQSAYGLLVLGLRWSVWALAEADEGGQTLVKIWETKSVAEPEQMARAVSILRRIAWQAQARRGLVMQWLEGVYGGDMPTPIGKTPPPPDGELPTLMTPMPHTPPPAVDHGSAEVPRIHSLPPSPPHDFIPLHHPDLPPPDFRDPFQDSLLARRRSFILDPSTLAPRRHSDNVLPRRHSVYPGHTATPTAYFPPPPHYAAASRPLAPMSTGYSARSVHFPPPPPLAMPPVIMRAPSSPSLHPFPSYSPVMTPLMSPYLAPNFTGGSLRPSFHHYELTTERPRSLRSLHRSSQRGRQRTTSLSRPRNPRDSTKNSSHRRSASAGGALQGGSRRNSRSVGSKKVGAASTGSTPGILARSWNMFKRK